MKKKDTRDLQKELTSTPDLRLFLSENQDNFHNTSFSEQLNALFLKSGLSKAALAQKAGISEVYLYQIFSGGRTPSRDRTICLCFGLSISLEDTQQLLQENGFAKLYVKDRRDAIIIFGLSNQLELNEVNDLLFSESEETLC